MKKDSKVIEAVLSGKQDANMKFKDLQNLLISLGFQERCVGDHFIYKHPSYLERINIQPDGNKAKKYQVRQIRELITKYGMEV